jgi:hypothetical protein
MHSPKVSLQRSGRAPTITESHIRVIMGYSSNSGEWQLEELYYPLSDFLDEYREVPCASRWGENQQDSSTAQRELQYLGDREDSHDGCVIISDMVRRKYLFKEKETKVFFRLFVEDKHCQNNISSDMSLRTYDELKRLVEEDIYMLEVKLRALTT